MAKLVSNLSKIAREAPSRASSALRQTANDIATMTKQLAPIDTGALQRSYRVEIVSPTEMRIGSDLDYAIWVEYGTTRMEKQPHLTPAFKQAEETFRARLRQAMESS